MATISSCTQARGLDYYAPSLFLDTPSSPPQEQRVEGEAMPGFPPRYTGERVWSGPEMALKQHEWIVVLSEQDQVHILEALRHFQG